MSAARRAPPFALFSLVTGLLTASALGGAWADDNANDGRHVGGRLIAYTTPVGSREVNAAVIEPYVARWTTQAGTIEESLDALDDQTWRHTQTRFRETNGEMIKTAVETRTLSRKDLRSLSWAQEFHVESPNLPFRDVSVVVAPHGISGEMTNKEGEKEPYDAPLPMPVFDGWIAGLAIAALPLEEEYWASLPTATYVFKGVHHLTVSVVGRASMEAGNGDKIDAWEVNAEWVDLGSGDIYEGGAEGSGGVYYIAAEPGDGVPYVLKYEAQQALIVWDGQRRRP